jgi:hypothetical protein
MSTKQDESMTHAHNLEVQHLLLDLAVISNAESEKANYDREPVEFHVINSVYQKFV